MTISETQKKLHQYFTKKLETHGATAKGVDYNGEQSQKIRFAELIKIISPDQKYTLIDYGCGYGAMFEFINSLGHNLDYYGIDLIEKMVVVGREKYKEFPNAHFTTREDELPLTDYLTAAGIFNIKLEASYEEWQEFVCKTLLHINTLCSKGFSFNMLTTYSDKDRMALRPDLFYGDPLFFFDFCKRNISRNISLLHDYNLYDFTILVRKYE